MITGCGGGSSNQPEPDETSGGGSSNQPEAAAISYTITTFTSSKVNISPPTQTVAPGSVATFEISIDGGSMLEGVHGCDGALDGSTYTTASITADCVISSVYTPMIQQNVPDTDTTGPQKTLFALVALKGQSKELTLQDIKQLVTENQNSLNKFIITNSNGKAWIDAEFLDWIDLEKPSYVNYSTEFVDDVIDALSRNPEVNLGEIDRLVLMGTKGDDGIGCYAKKIAETHGSQDQYHGSLAILGGGMNSKEGFFCINPGRIAHEYGHTFNFDHAITLQCPLPDLKVPESLFDVDGGQCEWGNSLMHDTMGDDADYPLYSTVWRAEAGWIDESQVTTIDEFGVYPLEQSSVSSPGQKLLKIYIGQGMQKKDLFYYVEYRKKLGLFDPPEFGVWDGTYSAGQSDAYNIVVRHSDFKWGPFYGDLFSYQGKDSRNREKVLDLGVDFIDEYRDIRFSVKSIKDDHDLSTVEIEVHPPRARIVPSYLYRVETEGETATFSVKNISSDDFRVNSASISGRTPDGFEITSNNCFDQIIAPNEQCDITVKRTGLATAVISYVDIQINDGDIKQAVALTGISLGQETPYDPDNAVEWQDFSSGYGAFLNWDDARAYCENLISDNKNDWRLPTLDELRAEFQPNGEPSRVNVRLWSNTERKNDIFNDIFLAAFITEDQWLRGHKTSLFNSVCIRDN